MTTSIKARVKDRMNSLVPSPEAGPGGAKVFLGTQPFSTKQVHGFVVQIRQQNPDISGDVVVMTYDASSKKSKTLYAPISARLRGVGYALRKLFSR